MKTPKIPDDDELIFIIYFVFFVTRRNLKHDRRTKLIILPGTVMTSQQRAGDVNDD